jgi:GDP-4-dehydro-6-deoxy-D-mannose reductase
MGVIMRICIPGGVGSGGSYLCEYILNNHPDCEIWIPARWHSTSVLNNINHIKNRIIVKECDLNDLSSVIRFLKECMPDRIFNMAATANVAVAFKTPLAVLQNNIFSTANLLEAVRLICPETIFQQCSTSEVIGQPLTVPITEEHPLNACNPYAVSKLAAEKLAFAYWKAWNINVVITRAFCYWNPRRHDLFASSFALQVARIESGKQDKLYHGSLDSIRTGMDVREMMEAYWIASEKCEYGTPYNLGGKEPVSVRDILNILKRKAKVPIVSEVKKDLLRPSDISNQVPDVSKFENRTGWKSKITLDESMNWLLDCARETVKKESL